MAFTKKTWVDKGQTGATPLNATNLNNLEDRIAAADSLKQNKLTVEQISSSDFFESLNVTLTGFYVYKYGNIINIQRIAHSSVNFTNEITVGTIKDKYLPYGGVSIRTSYQNDKTPNTPGKCFILANGYLQYTASGAGSTAGYIYNTSYICKG